MSFKKWILFVLFASSVGYARPAPFYGFEKGQDDLTFFAGQPTFLRYDRFLSWKRSWSVDVGWHFDGYPYFAGNYIYYFYDVKDRYRHRDFFNSLMFYAGPGFFFGPDLEESDTNKKIKVGVRTFIGSEYIFLKTNLSLKAEFGPVFFIEGDHFVGLQAMLGLTYYFGGLNHNKKLKQGLSVEDSGVDAPKIEKTPDDEFKDFD
jgi:hypothetical protein